VNKAVYDTTEAMLLLAMRRREPSREMSAYSEERREADMCNKTEDGGGTTLLIPARHATVAKWHDSIHIQLPATKPQ